MLYAAPDTPHKIPNMVRSASRAQKGLKTKPCASPSPLPKKHTIKVKDYDLDN
jgi:hypothetical protein